MTKTPSHPINSPVQDPDHELGHVVDPRTYRSTLLALLGLTVVTVFASRINFGTLNIVIAILVASLKASLVALFFMHLRFERKLVLAFAIYPILILALLLGGTLSDEMMRTRVAPAPTVGTSK